MVPNPLGTLAGDPPQNYERSQKRFGATVGG